MHKFGEVMKGRRHMKFKRVERLVESYLNKTFGKMTILELIERDTYGFRWLGQCACGNLVSVRIKRGAPTRKECLRCQEETRRKMDRMPWNFLAKEKFNRRIIHALTKYGRPMPAREIKSAVRFRDDVLFDCFADLLDKGELSVRYNTHGERVYIIR